MNKGFSELLKLYEQAVKLEQTNPQAAIALLDEILADSSCPKSLRMTTEKLLSSLVNRVEPAQGTSAPEEKKKILKDAVHYVDPYAIELIPALENLMPISNDQYAKLKGGIAKKGVQTPLFITIDFKLLAGYNRLRIAKELGLKAVPVLFKDLDRRDILEFAIRDNIERRHMDMNDIAAFVDKLNLHTKKGPPPKGSHSKTTQEVADLLQVSPRSVERTKKFLKKVKENPALTGKGVNEVVGEIEPANRKSMSFAFTEGLDLTEENLSANLALIADEIFDFDLHGGDKIKMVVQLWHIKGK